MGVGQTSTQLPCVCKPCTHSGPQDSKSLCSNDPRQKAQGPAAQQGPWTSSMPIQSAVRQQHKGNLQHYEGLAGCHPLMNKSVDAVGINQT